MKLQEIFNDVLLELKLRHALAATALAALSPIKDLQEPIQRQSQPITMAKEKPFSPEEAAEKIRGKYKISIDDAIQIAKLAKKHEDKTFPKADTILAMIGVESSFKPAAKSNLKSDKAFGLTQIRPKVWNTSRAALATPEAQIKKTVEILKSYRKQAGSDDGALEAYNIGIGNYTRDENRNPRYVEKIKREKRLYK